MRAGIRIGRFALGAALLTVWGCEMEEADLGEQQRAGEVAMPAEERAPEAAPSDAQIAHIAVTANTIDVSMAQLVDERTETPEVREFAETMIRDHTALNEEATTLMRRLGVDPETNAVSESLRRDADAAAEELQTLRGEEFDRAYIDREIEYHQQVLDALDQTLIPSASNPELRALLQQVRPVIEAHLQRAQALRPQVTAAR